MFNKGNLLLAAAIFVCCPTVQAATQVGRYFDRVVTIIFENANYADVMKQPFFKEVADKGAHFNNFMALTHPSQANYIAQTSGSLNGVSGDGKYDLDVPNIVDLLEAKKISWKVYAENYPGNCFVGTSSGKYVRKHNPFISYVNIQKNPARCANIVEAAQFDKDAAAGTLPAYVFYIPNMDNDGHDTGVAFANNWYKQKFSPYFNSAKFMSNTVFITTWDESGSFFGKNQIYTTISGPAVKPGVFTNALNLYSLMHLMEDNWSLGNLQKEDATATPIPNIWQ